MSSWILPNDVLATNNILDSRAIGSQPKRKAELPGDGLSVQWGRGKQDDSRSNCKACLSRWIGQLTDEHSNSDITLEGLYASFRISSWGSIHPLSYWENRIQEDIAKGMVIDAQTRSPVMRPVIVIGTWKLSRSVTITAFFLSPAISTSIQRVSSIPEDVVSRAMDYVYVESPSSSMKDNVSITKSYGPTKMSGRLACSVANVIESNVAFSDYSKEITTPTSLHLGCSKLLYFIQHGSKTYTCTTSLSTLEKFRLYADDSINTVFDGFMSLSIYSDTARRNSVTGMGRRPSDSSSSCVRLLVDGNLRFLGKVHAVAKTFRDFHNLIQLSMATTERASSIVGSLRILSST